MRGRWTSAALAAGALGATFVSNASAAVFAQVPAPGHPEGIVVYDDLVAVATGYTAFTLIVPSPEPSRVFWFDRDDGHVVATATADGQDLSRFHALVGLAADGQGRVYTGEQTSFGLGDGRPARILRFTREGASGRQELYAELPDVPTCGLAESGAPCSPTDVDRSPVPNSIAFDIDGTAYLSDTSQAAIWRIPAGGGTARLWFADRRLDGVAGGPNGIALDHARRQLYLATSPETRGGVVWRLPLIAAPAGGDLAEFATYPQPATIIDGLALGEAGDLYVTVASADAISRLDHNGREVERIPAEGASPASLAFDGRGSLFVANQDFTNPGVSGTVTRLSTLDAGLAPVRPDIDPPAPSDGPRPRPCTSRRTVLIRIRGVRSRPRRVVVHIGGRARRVPARRTVRVRLAGRPGSTVRVRVVAITRGGRRVVDRRTYRRCRPARPG